MRVRNPDARDDLADQFSRSTGADIREGHGEACYVPSRDFISMPAFEAFKGADHFYSVAFHELGRWVGHKDRLDRDLKNRFGSKNYAAEELVAELCAAFLCAEFGFDGDLRHAGYIEHWIELLKADKRASFTACSQSVKSRRLPARLGACGADAGAYTLRWKTRPRCLSGNHRRYAELPIGPNVRKAIAAPRRNSLLSLTPSTGCAGVALALQSRQSRV
jgi:hypothetical protein